MMIHADFSTQDAVIICFLFSCITFIIIEHIRNKNH